MSCEQGNHPHAISHHLLTRRLKDQVQVVTIIVLLEGNDVLVARGAHNLLQRVELDADGHGTVAAEEGEGVGAELDG